MNWQTWVAVIAVLAFPTFVLAVIVLGGRRANRDEERNQFYDRPGIGAVVLLLTDRKWYYVPPGEVDRRTWQGPFETQELADEFAFAKHAFEEGLPMEPLVDAPLSLRLLNWWKGRCEKLDGSAVGVWGQYKEIWSHGQLYLSRVFITNHAYLHYYHTADGDPALHDHPWRWAFSIVLWGWYDEERQLGWAPDGPVTVLVRRRWFNWLGGNSWHRIDRVRAHSLTLFLTGPKFKTWSFLDSQTLRPVHWSRYLERREAQRSK